MLHFSKALTKDSTWHGLKISKNCVGGTIIVLIISFIAIAYFYHAIFTQERNLGFKRRHLVRPTLPNLHINDSPFHVSAHHILFEIGSGSFVNLTPRKIFQQDVIVQVLLDDPTVIETISSFVIKQGFTGKIHIPLHSKNGAGECTLSFKTKQDQVKGLYRLKLNVRVVHNIYFGYLSIFIGWACFLLWSISFYPQFLTNFKRKSVVGLSLDYVMINTLGHYCYLIFNTSMYFNRSMQKAYASIHPRSDLPVKLNDVFFSVHAAFIMTFICIQCFLYEKGNQKVSVMSHSFVGICICFLLASLVAAVNYHISWLNWIYYFSYVKVLVTPVKYTPQVYLNWKRKTTEGFNIKGCTLDFTGSMFNTLQMLIDSFNHDSLDETFGNPGKLLLGLIGIIYNSIFFTQRFILYGNVDEVSPTRNI